MSTTAARPGTRGSSRRLQFSGRYRSVLARVIGQVSRLDALDHTRVGERRRVAQGVVLGNVAQQSAHDLARPGLREFLGEQDRGGLGDRTDELRDVVTQFRNQAVVGFDPKATEYP
mgnify:CR=1 FL=1